ncbi:MAG: aminomethyl transferase family protein, partial [Acidimicrobiales bacterium]
YYVTPFELGYGRHVAFDHDFVGRAALEEMAKNPRRTKVTLVWHPEDVLAAMGTLLGEAVPAKLIDWPKSRYSLFQSDKVQKDGRQVGISMDCGYDYNDRAMLSLATIENELAEPGTEVVVVWGEEPNSSKPQVEPHRQVEIRATVAPVPYAELARGAYRRS